MKKFLPGCTGKMIYVSRKEAVSQIRDWNNKNGHVHEYQCPYWDHWHITSLPKGKYKKVKGGGKGRYRN